MGEPVRNPETGGRSLADILREAGIENPTRAGRRRRWDDMDDTGIRQRRAADAAREEAAARAEYGRRAGDLALDRPEVDRSSGMPRVRDERFRRLQPSDAPAADERIRGPRPPEERQRREDRQPDDRRGDDRRLDDRRRRVPGRDVPGRDVTGRDVPAEDVARDPLRDTGRRATARPEPPRAGRPGDPSTAAIPGLRPSRTPSVPGTASGSTAGPGGSTAAPASAPASAPAAEAPPRERRQGRPPVAPTSDTGRIPISDRDDLADDLAGRELDAAPRESALAWLRFAGELVIAAAVGVGVYFAFTVLWEMQPHLAALASPLVVTGLVLGVSTWRQRSGRGPLGGRLLGVLVFAGTILTVLPAAGLISG